MDNTQDLSKFGTRELTMAKDLLEAYLNNNNTEYLGDGVTIEFNPNSGCVFMVDEDFNVAMESDGELLDFFTSPYDGKEGFYEDLKAERDEMHPEDQEWFDSLEVN